MNNNISVSIRPALGSAKNVFNQKNYFSDTQIYLQTTTKEQKISA
jgi:hypothetical protein